MQGIRNKKCYVYAADQKADRDYKIAFNIKMNAIMTPNYKAILIAALGSTLYRYKYLIKISLYLYSTHKLLSQLINPLAIK